MFLESVPWLQEYALLLTTGNEMGISGMHIFILSLVFRVQDVLFLFPEVNFFMLSLRIS
jgi:hypothetical protein